MINEKYTIKIEETSLNVVMSEIESIRKKNITKTGFRCYDNGKIGVSGAIGEYDEEEMKAKAAVALSLDIKYPCEPTGKIKKCVDIACDFKDGVAFTKEIEAVLSELKEKHPDFIFSNKINLVKEMVSLKNDLGLDLNSTISRIESSLLLKEKSSPNLLDAFIGLESTKWDREEYLRIADMLCDGLANEADVENGFHKVILVPDGCDFMGKLYSELHGLKFGTGGSILAGKIGEKLFSEDFTLYQSNATEDGVLNNHFFDAEGTVNEDFRYTLIENGVLKAPYTDKKTAKQYNLEHTGSAGAAYDSVPSLVPTPIVIKKSEKSIKELMNGEKAIFVMFAAGGDFTPEGKYATPVQTSFLFDGEKFIGRLPQLNLASNVFDMFGKDFLGVSSDSFTSLSHMPLTFMQMKVEKI